MKPVIPHIGISKVVSVSGGPSGKATGKLLDRMIRLSHRFVIMGWEYLVYVSSIFLLDRLLEASLHCPIDTLADTVVRHLEQSENY